MCPRCGRGQPLVLKQGGMDLDAFAPPGARETGPEHYCQRCGYTEK